MSFEKYKEKVEDGDTVILFLGFGNMLQVTIESGKTHQTKYGAFRHSDIIGKKYGCKIQATKGWLHILHPTPELWTVNLPHRTQILYTTDISMITMQLDLRPGAIVLEAGTGSASLSHAILRTIAPSGHLHTFDFHEVRAEKARVEFAHHGFGDLVTTRHRDVCKEGFDLEHVADAVFLDLPLPWEAVPFAKNSLKSEGGRICSFSPCIEQVQKTCEALHQNKFGDIQTLECLVRTFDPKTINMPLPDLGFDDLGKTPGDNYVDVGQSVHKPSVGQIEISSKDSAQKQPDNGQEQSEPRADSKTKDECEKGTEESSNSATKGQKRKRENDHSRNDKDKEQKDAKAKANFVFKSGLTPKEMPGHTGYLTFATLHSV